jgi:hypothetical protein
MNTDTTTQMVDCNSEDFLEFEMANLLQMTNQVVMKIKQQTKERIY